jgi:phage shock protein PspC (stress-responsive transcriptional regulator)
VNKWTKKSNFNEINKKKINMQHKIISGKKIEEQLMKELKRNPHLGKIAGICKGLGDYFNIDPVIFRLLFLLGLFSGGGLIVYIIGWFIIPTD